MSDNQKKILAKRIKADLKREIASGDLTEFSDYGLVDDGNFFSINEHHILARKSIFEPSDVEKEDYQEIVDLIRQRLQLQAEALAKERRRKEEKLDSNPRLFYHSACRKDKAGVYEKRGMKRYHQFWGRKNGQDYNINIFIDHSVLNNVLFHDKFDNPKNGNFYLIDGVENLPSEPNIPQHWEVEGHFFKWVELENNLTITPYSNNSGALEKRNKKIGFCNKCNIDYKDTESWYYPLDESRSNSWEKLDWFCGKCWQQEEKNYRQKSSRENTVYKSEPRKSNLGDEHYYYFENGHWISLESGIPDPNTTNLHVGDNPQSLKDLEKIFEKEWKDKDNKNIVDIRIGMLIKIFHNWNIKSVELTSTGDLSIKYQDGSSEILGSASSEKVIIESYLKAIGEKKIDQQKLEKRRTNFQEITTSTNSPKPDYFPYLMGGGIVFAILVIFWIGYRLRNQKKNK